MIKSLLISFLLLFNYGFTTVNNSDIVTELNKNFSKGDAKDIAQHFAPTIELIILEDEDIYSKAQAELILKDFFSKNNPRKTEQKHLINKPNFMWYVFNLHTNSGIYRISISLKTSNSDYTITELRIEPSVK